MTEDPEWRKQYELFMKYLSDENHRYWSRFNISILLNGGLIVAFSSLLSLAEKSLGLRFSTFGLFSITILGIIFSYLWYKMTLSANSWHKFNTCRINEIEKNITEDLRILPFVEGTIKSGSITKVALLHPKIFLIFWCCLLVFLILLLLKIITV